MTLVIFRHYLYIVLKYKKYQDFQDIEATFSALLSVFIEK